MKLWRWGHDLRVQILGIRDIVRINCNWAAVERQRNPPKNSGNILDKPLVSNGMCESDPCWCVRGMRPDFQISPPTLSVFRADVRLYRTMQVRKSIFQDTRQNYTWSRVEDHFLAGGSTTCRAVVILPDAIVWGHPAEAAFGKVGHIGEAVEYIHRNVHRPFGLEELLKICAMSKRTFEREFVAQLGIDPYSFINRCRVERACMLLNPRRNHLVKDVASMSGFSSAGRFRSIFRRLMGVSPTDYQRKKGKGPKLKGHGAVGPIGGGHRAVLC